MYMSAPCMGCGAFFNSPVPWSNSIPHKQLFFWGCTAPRGDIENEPSRIAGRMTGLLRHLAKLCIRTTGVLSSAFLRRFERLSRRFSSASLHRNKKKCPLGAFLFLGRMTGCLRRIISLPCSVLFATARSPLVSSRLRFACLDYSYANRGSNPTRPES